MKPTAITAVLVLVSTVFASPSVYAADTTRAVALVRAMRTDEIAVATAKLAFINGSMRERYGKTNNACVKRIPYTEFTAGWARVVESVLTPQEVESSLVFFQSDAGVKYVEGLLRRMRVRQGDESLLPEVPGKEDITPAQIAAIGDFSRSDLGHKVVGKDLTLSAAAEAMGRQTTEQIAAKCGSK